MALAGTADLVIRIVTDTKKAAAGIDSASSSVSKFRSGLGVAAKASGVVLAGLTGAAVAFGKAAADDEKSQALLANAMKNGAGAGQRQIDSMEKWIDSASRASGVADDELRPAMSDLIRATGDAGKAQKDMRKAMDISAATGKPLASVTKAIAKGYGGSTTALSRLVPSIDKGAIASGNFQRILKSAASQTKGAMSDAANTAAGKFSRMQVSMNEAKEALGAGLLPVMGKFADIARVIGEQVAKHSKLFSILAGIIGGVAAAIITLNYALKAYDTIVRITTILNESAWASALGPIALVLAAIALVIAIFVLLYKKVKWFRDFVNAMWAGIKTAAKAFVAWLKAAWRVLFAALKAIGQTFMAYFRPVWRVAFALIKTYIQVFVAYFRLVFNTIKGVVRFFIAIFKGDWRGAWDAVKDLLRGFIQFFKDIFHALPGPVQDVFGTIKDKIAAAIGWVKDKWGALTKILTAPFDAVVGVIGDILGKIQDVIDAIGKIHIPDVGGLLGGLNPLSAAAPTVPTTRGVGAVVPMVGARGAAGNAAGGVSITVNGAIDPENVARQIQRILAGHDRRVGLRTA